MIRIENVSKTIKEREVLKEINLQLNEGDFILLKGHNGCGKTMLLRLIAGLIRPDIGKIQEEKEYSYGVIIENPSFMRNETAEYNLRYLASLNRKIGDPEIERWLKAFNLYDVRKKKVRSFSLGMKQRLAICQAVMEEPDILLLDEPFNGIDDDNVEEVYRILNSYAAENRIVIVASHMDCSDRCAITRTITMSDGRIKGDCVL